jgi:hypothetical protein
LAEAAPHTHGANDRSDLHIFHSRRMNGRASSRLIGRCSCRRCDGGPSG